ncbi:hypothetical protein Ciccas_006456 [Cichlidogyrus casuarinus]|uniref:Folliculin-interacting protein C-terminal domain-containing protein n=1 Tax=Cichlidogyrus casuarinus TaxID=1844966 RepID=A0ABD2Q5P8_9PLAT
MEEEIKELVEPPQLFSSVCPSRLVTQSLNRLRRLFEQSNCPVLALRQLESDLQMLYRKSQTVSLALELEGNAALLSPQRLAKMVGAHVEDLPLLLSLAHSCSVDSAQVLNSSCVDWTRIT